MLAARVLDADGPLAVVDAEGRVIGRLDRKAVLEVLVRREKPS
jgi:ribosomal protein L13